MFNNATFLNHDMIHPSRNWEWFWLVWSVSQILEIKVTKHFDVFSLTKTHLHIKMDKLEYERIQTFLKFMHFCFDLAVVWFFGWFFWQAFKGLKYGKTNLSYKFWISKLHVKHVFNFLCNVGYFLWCTKRI